MRVTLLLLTLLLILVAPLARTAEPLTETRAVALALESAAFSEWLASATTAANEQRRATARWHNPELSFARESLDLPGGESEENQWMVSQRFNLAGTRGLERRAAGHARDAELARLDLLRRERAAEVREQFYVALRARQRLALLEQRHNDIRALRDAITARARAGDASRFDQLRMEQALALSGGDLARQRSAVAAADLNLSAMMEAPVDSITGDLLPPPPPAESVQWLEAHPLIQALAAERHSAESVARANGRRWWPDMTVGVGRKDVSEPGLEADGNVVSLGIELPLGDSGAASAGTSRSRANQLAAEQRMTEARLRAQAQAELAAWRAGQQAHDHLAGVLGQGEIVRIAQVAYEAGEVGITALLDAYDSWLEVNDARLAHAMAARQARIQWQLLTGD